MSPLFNRECPRGSILYQVREITYRRGIERRGRGQALCIQPGKTPEVGGFVGENRKPRGIGFSSLFPVKSPGFVQLIFLFKLTPLFFGIRYFTYLFPLLKNYKPPWPLIFEIFFLVSWVEVLVFF